MPNKNKKTNFLRYTGMAFELFVLLFLLLFIGQKADAYFQLSNAYITAALLMIGLLAYFYKLIKDVS